jgi:tol-pal system protein YbgF
MKHLRCIKFFSISLIVLFSVFNYIGCSGSNELSEDKTQTSNPNDDLLVKEQIKPQPQSKTGLDSAKSANKKLQEDLDRTRQENQNLNNKIAELEGKLGDQKEKIIEESVRLEYNSALKSFSEKKYSESIAKFQKIYNDDPSGELAPNCLYWVGECYYGMKDYKQAILSLEQVISAYPDSHKKDASMLMIGNAYLRLKDKASAQEAYNRLQQTAPESSFIIKIPKAFRTK